MTAVAASNHDHVLIAKAIQDALPEDYVTPSCWADIYSLIFPNETVPETKMKRTDPILWCDVRKALIGEKHKAITAALQKTNLTMSELEKMVTPFPPRGCILSTAIITVCLMKEVGKAIAKAFFGEF